MNEKTEELKEAIEAAVLAEKVAVYFDGCNGSRKLADEALKHAFEFADRLWVCHDLVRV